MPTPESAAAFAKLVEARANLNEVTRQLNEAHVDMHSSTEARQRYLDLQNQWDGAFKEFETVTKEFAAAVGRIKGSYRAKSRSSPSPPHALQTSATAQFKLKSFLR